MIVIPVLSEERVAKVFGAVLDVSNLYEEFEKATETFTQIPGGIHRCYLSDPIHLEYYSEGLCKMLGYTADEVGQLIGADMDYCQLIHPEDREAFERFCVRIAASGGKHSIEYRMLCKDGSAISVADIMDAQRSSSGIMYGYSVVTNQQKYKKRQERLEKELAETKEHLEQLKIPARCSRISCTMHWHLSARSCWMSRNTPLICSAALPPT